MPRLIEISTDPAETADWRKELEAAISELDVRIAPDGTPPGEIDYLVFNIDGGLTDFTPYTRLRAILNTWAGVEKAVRELDWPANVPYCRMVESGMTEGMVQYFAAHTLRYHVDIDRAITQSAEAKWEKWLAPLPSQRRVGVLGLGALGAETARTLAMLGFDVTGWSRSAKQIDGVQCNHGSDGLSATLASSEILILILPVTPETENLLNAERLALMPRGACIINAGRGPLIDDAALLAALDAGQIRHATLDVFRAEPLPIENPFWRHPQVTITPHIAAETRFDTAAQSIADQIARDISGKPLLHVVDRSRGY